MTERITWAPYLGPMRGHSNMPEFTLNPAEPINNRKTGIHNKSPENVITSTIRVKKIRKSEKDRVELNSKIRNRLYGKGSEAFGNFNDYVDSSDSCSEEC